VSGIELIPQKAAQTWAALSQPFFLLERRTIMSENKLISALNANVQEPKSGEQRQTKGTYRAPRLVVLGTAVELVQGGNGSSFDRRTFAARN
jgi:hypothetical protein